MPCADTHGIKHNPLPKGALPCLARQHARLAPHVANSTGGDTVQSDSRAGKDRRYIPQTHAPAAAAAAAANVAVDDDDAGAPQEGAVAAVATQEKVQYVVVSTKTKQVPRRTCRDARTTASQQESISLSHTQTHARTPQFVGVPQ